MTEDSTTHRVLERIRNWLSIVAFVLIFAAIGWGFHAQADSSKTNCQRSLEGFKGLKNLALFVTTPTPLAAGITDPDLIAQHNIANNAKADARVQFLKKLDEAPRCTP